MIHIFSLDNIAFLQPPVTKINILLNPHGEEDLNKKIFYLEEKVWLEHETAAIFHFHKLTTKFTEVYFPKGTHLTRWLF